MKTILQIFTFLLYSSFAYSQDTPYISTAEAVEDIEYMISTFEEVHYNPYFNVKKEELDEAKKDIVQSWGQDSVALVKFITGGMKLSAMMSGGHSYMYWKVPELIPLFESHGYLPFTATINDAQTAITVLESSMNKIPTGTEVKSVNGIPAVDLFKEAMTLTGGIESSRVAYCETMFPFFLFFNSKVNGPYVVRDLSDRVVYDSDGLAFEDFAGFINGLSTKEDYSFRRLNDTVGLIAYNSCKNYSAFKKFLKKTFAEIDEEGIDKLIIDIRENGGGDSSLNDDLLSYITEKPYRQASGRYWKVSEQSKEVYSSNPVYARIFGKEFMATYMAKEVGEVIIELDSELIYPTKPKFYFEGKTCFLIGPSTFSSANFLADAVKTYRLSTLIGKSTGEYTNDFGEQLSFSLPNSGARVYISSTYDIGASGDPSALQPVHPDVSVQSDALKFAEDWLETNE